MWFWLLWISQSQAMCTISEMAKGLLSDPCFHRALFSTIVRSLSVRTETYFIIKMKCDREFLMEVN